MVGLKVPKFGNSLWLVLSKDVINGINTGGGEALFLIKHPVAVSTHALRYGLRKENGKAEGMINRFRNILHVLSK